VRRQAVDINICGPGNFGKTKQGKKKKTHKRGLDKCEPSVGDLAESEEGREGETSTISCRSSNNSCRSRWRIDIDREGDRATEWLELISCYH
jgi:hypothetical protein